MAYNSYVGNQQQRLCNARKAVSRLQTLLGGTNQELDLPGIVVVGNQSVGKSSLLEGISGIRLPSAMGICTKCPLQLELHTSSSTSISISYPDPDKGMQSSPITNEVDIPKEIQRVSNLLTGGANKIVKSVITLKVASPTAPNLTLIDLPGVVGASPANYPEDTKDIINDLVTHYSTGESKIVCFLMQAGLDAGGQSAGLALIKKLDPAGLRTVGVLTKVDALAVPGDVRKHILNTLGGQGYPLKNGYFAVKNRYSEEGSREVDMSDAEIRQLEAEFFQNSPDFSPPPCGVSVPSLVHKLEELQWDVYKKYLPGLERQLLTSLAQYEHDLSGLPKTVDSNSEALSILTNGLSRVANEVRAACGPNLSGVDLDLREEDDMIFGPKFKAASEMFISQVTSTTGHEAHQVNKDGLTGLLWSPEVTAIIAKMMAQMEGTVLENLYQHPEFVGRTFEKVVYPRLRGPAEHLILEVQALVKAVFTTTVREVFKTYPEVSDLILRQVEAMLKEQAGHAKIFINESIEMLLGYHNTFNKRYISTCASILHDSESFKGQGSKSLEELKANLGFVSLAEPFMTTLFPAVKELGGMAGVLAALIGRQNALPEGAVAAAAGISGLSTQHFTQMCFAVYAQIVLDRIFDDYPLAIRMFLVQKVHKLLENHELENRLSSTLATDELWDAMKAGQEEVVERRASLSSKIREFRQVAAVLSDPTGATLASDAAAENPDVER